MASISSGPTPSGRLSTNTSRKCARWNRMQPSFMCPINLKMKACIWMIYLHGIATKFHLTPSNLSDRRYSNPMASVRCKLIVYGFCSALRRTYVRAWRNVCDLGKLLCETEEFKDAPSARPDHHAGANFSEASSTLVNVDSDVRMAGEGNGQAKTTNAPATEWQSTSLRRRCGRAYNAPYSNA